MKCTSIVYILALLMDHFVLMELGFPFSPSFLILIILFLLLIFFHGKWIFSNINHSSILIGWAVFFFYLFLSMLVTEASPKGEQAFDHFIIRISYFFIPVIISFVLRFYPFEPGWLVFLAAIICVFLGYYGMNNYYGSRETQFRLTFSEDYNPTWYAAILGLIILILLHELFNFSLLLKLIAIFMLITMFFYLLLTQGRNAMVGLVMALIIYFFNNFSVKRFLIISGTLGFLIFLFIVNLNLFTKLELDFSRVELLIDYLSLSESNTTMLDSNDASAGRTERWKDYLSIPPTLFGQGYNSSAFILGKTYGNPHNSYILVFVEFGLIGFLIYILVNYYLWKRAFSFSKSLKSTSNLPLAILVYLLVISMGNDVIYYKYFWIGITFFLIYFVQFSRKVSDSENLNS